MSNYMHYPSHQVKFGIYIFLCWAMITTFNIFGQESLNFTNITQRDGLASDYILCMLQDHQGFMWIGTGNGLNRFDGEHFLTYRLDPDDSESISENFINSLFYDSFQRLWVGTFNGLNLYVNETGKFKRIPFVNKVGQQKVIRVNAIFEDHHNDIWISTDNNGLYKLRDSQVEEEIIAMSFEFGTDSVSLEQKSDQIQIIHIDQDFIWLSTEKGIARINISTKL